MLGMVLFELLSVDTSLLPNLRFRNPFPIVGIESLISVLRTVFYQMTFDVTALANITRTRFTASKAIKLHLRAHHLRNLVTVKLHSRVHIHILL
jgi:hypothetical protein